MRAAGCHGRPGRALVGWLVLVVALGGGATAADPTAETAADDPWRPCVEGFAADPDDYDASFCFYQVARQHRAWDEASRRLEQLIAQNPANHWPRLVLAHIHWRVAPERAETTYRSAAAGFADQDHDAGEVLARTNLHDFLVRQGEVEKAEIEVERVVALAANSDDPELVGRARVLEADHLRHLGHDFEAAHRLLIEAESLVFPGGPYRLRRACLIALGSVSFRLGRYAEARVYYERLEALARGAGDDYAGALYRYNQANTTLAEGFELPAVDSHPRLLALFEEALAAAEEVGHRSAQLQSHRSLGDLLSPLAERRQEASHHYQRCVELARASRRSRRLATCLWALGGHLARWSAVDGTPSATIDELFDQSLGLAHDSESAEEIARTLEKRMRASWALGPRERALDDTDAAVEAVETFRELQPAASGRVGVFAVWSDLYAWPAGRLLAGSEVGGLEEVRAQPTRQDLELAFDLVERLRARELLAALASSRVGAVVERPTADGWAELRSELAAIQRRLLDPALEGEERQQALRELERVERREAAALSSPATPSATPGRTANGPTAVAQDDVGALGLGAGFADLEAVESALAADEALLSFQVALWKDVYGDFGGGSWLLASTREGTRVYAIPDRVALRPAVRMLDGLIAGRDGSEVTAAVRLYELLLAQALDDLPKGIRSLVVVPDGDLHRLAFGALRPTAEAEPLVARYRLSRVPSATLWLRWRRAMEEEGEENPRRAVLALADPTLPWPADGVATRRDWALAGGGGLGALPHARDEGRAVVRRVGGESRLWVGEGASERALAEVDLEPFGLVHFATHAVIDAKHPQRSAVLLAATDEGEDGLLQPRDVVALDLRDRVVVLSACQSASGAVLRGEGVLSLARAFFEAGATTVVGSLWPVRDDATAELVDRFYHHLAMGETVAAALVAAQRDLLEGGAPAADWAGLMVLGDGERVPLPGGVVAVELSLGRAMVILATALVLVALTLRRRPSTPSV